jgi:acetyl-CoA carboxylase biotin carboxyl carrier protein
MTLEEIKELIRVVTETGIAELELQRGDDRVRIRQGSNSFPREIEIPAPAHAANSAAASAGAPGPHAPAHHTSPAAPTTEAQAAEVASDPSLVLVKSPIVGTFYEAPSPDSPPFVRIGETVHPGQVLCIIESMKLMNEIECENEGVIVSKLVGNGQAVEYGEALFAIRPARD